MCHRRRELFSQKKKNPVSPHTSGNYLHQKIVFNNYHFHFFARAFISIQAVAGHSFKKNLPIRRNYCNHSCMYNLTFYHQSCNLYYMIIILLSIRF